MAVFISVVLPMPFRPRSATASPCPHLQRDAEQDRRGAVAGVQVAHAEHVSRRRRPGRRRSPRGSLRMASGGPSAIFSPKWSTAMRSEMPMTTLMSCSISSTVSPRCWRDPPEQRGGLLASRPGVMPAVGSSSRSRRRLAWPGPGRSRGSAARRGTRFSASSSRRAAEPEGLQQLHHRAVDVGPPPQRGQAAGLGGPRLGGDPHVVEDGDLREDVGDLEGLGEAAPVDHLGRQPGDVLALERAPGPRWAGGGPEITLKSVDLPAPLGPITEKICPRADREADVGERGQRAEALGDPVDLEDHGRRRCHWPEPETARGGRAGPGA